MEYMDNRKIKSRGTAYRCEKKAYVSDRTSRNNADVLPRIMDHMIYQNTTATANRWPRIAATLMRKRFTIAPKGLASKGT